MERRQFNEWNDGELWEYKETIEEYYENYKKKYNYVEN